MLHKEMPGKCLGYDFLESVSGYFFRVRKFSGEGGNFTRGRGCPG